MNGKQNSTRGMATNNILYFVMFFDLCKAPAAVFQYFWNEIFLDLFMTVLLFIWMTFSSFLQIFLHTDSITEPWKRWVLHKSAKESLKRKGWCYHQLAFAK